MNNGALRRGSRIGKYRLDKRIGEGSFATVWRARDTIEQRAVALKITHPETVDSHGREELENEARIAARLQHPNIVSVRNADWVGKTFVIATDLAERNLAEYRSAKRSPRIALQVVRDTLAGLAHAHSARVMHRDLKPENILIFPDRRAALGDFGVSRFAHDARSSYTEAGTLGYMAPEQAYGRPRLASDVFSLGLLAYELLTGHLLSWPFDWPPPEHKRFKARVPEPLWPVLRKAANFEPSARYVDAIVFHEAFERAMDKVEQKPAIRIRRRRKPKEQPDPLALEAEIFRRRHGRALALSYTCHRCSGPIAESMSCCPWCGTWDNSFREITKLPLFCPDCERGVHAEWSACPWCYAGRFESNGKEPKPDAAAERICSKPGCNGELRRFMRYCPVCKTKPKRPWSHEELHDRCPRCRWPVSLQSWRYCPWCGRREPHAGTFAASR